MPIKKRINGLYVALFLSFFWGACSPSNPPVPTPPPTSQEALVVTPIASPTALPAASPTLPPSPQPSTPTPAGCTDQTGKSIDASLPLPSGKELSYRVHMPPCLAEEGGSYPVLYLLHGQGFSLDQWENLGFSEVLDALVVQGTIDPFLVVYPAEPDPFADPFSVTFAEDIRTELVSAIDADYPTCTLPACRAIGGLSRGAAWALLLGIQHPDVFSIVGAHSPAPFIGSEPLLRKAATAKTLERSTFWFDTGISDRYRKPAADFQALFVSFGIPHEWHLQPGDHDEAYWAAHVPDYVRWYAAQFSKYASPGEP